MTLYELLKDENDYDTYDTEFDCVVTCCGLDEIDDDEYSKFCNTFYKKFECTVEGENVIVDYSGFIKKNYSPLKAFADKRWNETPDDEDDFTEIWINEFNLWLSGYLPENVYEETTELINACEA